MAEAFWSEVTGIPVIPSVFPGRCSYLGQPDPWRHEVILHLVRTEKGPEPNRSHVDIWVRDVDRAIEQVEAIGGRRKRSPTIYPRPGSYPGEEPLLDWAVAQDPFGNEFCLIRLLRHTGVTEGGVTFLELGPLGPMRQFSEHARKLFS